MVSLSPELEPAPSVLHKRRKSGSSVKSFIKTPPSPSSSLSSSTFPSPEISRLSPNPNHPSLEIDHNGSPIRKRERVRSFVKSIRSTSSQLFKKDKKDGDSRKTISALVSDSLSVSTAATAPHILRRLSHSKQPSMSSMASVTTTESDLSTGYLEVKVGSGEGSISSPIIEVDTPVTPTVVQPLDVVPMGQLEEEDTSQETEPKPIQSFPSLNDPSLPEAESESTEHPDPLQFPLPQSPISSTLPITDPFDLIQISVIEPEVERTTDNDDVATLHDDMGPRDDVVLHDDVVSRNDMVSHSDEVVSHSDEVVSHSDEVVSHSDGVVSHNDESHGDTAPHDDVVPLDGVAPHDGVASYDDVAQHDDTSPQCEPKDHSPSDQLQPPALTDTALEIPQPDETPQPSSTILPPSVPSPDTDRDKEDREMRDLCIPVLIPPMLFWPISNMRLTYFFTPVLTWWLSKGVLSYPYLYS